jgi:hypothetical protein
LRIIIAVAATLALASPTLAKPPRLSDPLVGLGFLVGDWKSEDGTVADTGGTSHGASHFTVEADGKMLLRRDRTETFDKTGKPTGSFGQIMLIYAEGGAIHADYGDGEGHVIHYTSVEMDPGRLAVFTAPATASSPGFLLSYTATTSANSTPDLVVEFDLRPPGGGPLHSIASGILHKVR